MVDSAAYNIVLESNETIGDMDTFPVLKPEVALAIRQVRAYDSTP